MPHGESNRSSTENQVTGCLRGRPLQVVCAMAANLKKSTPEKSASDGRRSLETSSAVIPTAQKDTPLSFTSVDTCALAANVISLSFGTAVGYTSAVLPELQLHYSDDQISWIVPATLIGALIGPTIWSQITPRIGPQKGAIVSGIPTLISWCLLLNISNLWCVVSGRILNGVAMGGLLSTVPHYISEIAEDSLRGSLGSIMVLTFNIGTLFVYGLGGYLTGFQVALVCAVIPVVFMVVFFPCPESPIYLLNNGRADEGRHILKKLRYPADISTELATISASSRNSTEDQKARWADLFRNKAPRKALGISMVMFMIQQISGIIPLLSYVGDIFKRAGGSIDPIAGSCIVGAFQIVGSLFSIVLIERAGRRVLMLFSCVVMAISHGFLGYALMPNSTAPGWLPVTSLSVFVIAYSVGAGSVPYVIMTELSAPSLKPMIASLAMAFNCTFTFIITKTYADSIRLLDVNGVFWMYAAGCVAGGIFVLIFLPETSGKSNTSIQEQLEGRRIT